MKEGNLIGVLTWIVGILVSLTVGSMMAYGLLFIGAAATSPIIPLIITQIAGWVVVIGAILSLILAIFNN